MESLINVLLVEDSLEDTINIRRTIKKINETSTVVNINCIEAKSLEGGLGILASQKVDSVILDLSLPDGDGIECIEAINKKYSIPIVVLTGNEDEAVSLSAIKAGAQDFLIKREITPHTISKAIMFAVSRFKMASELEDMRIQQAQSMKMATLGEMAGGLAHEINNPLTIILGYADRLIKIAGTRENADDLGEYGEKIRKVTQRVAKIIRGLKSYSRNDESDPYEVTSYEQILVDTLSLCKERFKSAGVDIIIENTVDVELYCKDVQISQVILNILNNSFDAIKDMDNKWINIESRIEEDAVEIYITDCGCIENKEVRTSMFKPFFTTKERGKGTGLGMSICKNIIDKHEGSIELLNTENTTFKISLPISQQQMKKAG